MNGAASKIGNSTYALLFAHLKQSNLIERIPFEDVSNIQKDSLCLFFFCCHSVRWNIWLTLKSLKKTSFSDIVQNWIWGCYYRTILWTVMVMLTQLNWISSSLESSFRWMRFVAITSITAIAIVYCSSTFFTNIRNDVISSVKLSP